MASLNRVMIIGNCGKDAEPRYTNSGQCVAKFSVATSEKFGDADNRQERVEWHNIVIWGRQAELAAQYIRKGRQVYIEGRLQTDSWVDPQGVKHWKTEVVATRFLLLGNRDAAPVHGMADVGPALGEDEFDIGELGPPLSPGD